MKFVDLYIDTVIIQWHLKMMCFLVITVTTSAAFLHLIWLRTLHVAVDH